jgi:GntR family transcriptional regulator
MTALGLNKHSHTPLYRQLVSKISTQIASGELQPGDQVPSEREMAKLYNVSRITARLAVDELVANGLIYREQGRGSFVAEPMARGLMGFASLTEDLIARGSKPGSRILVHELIRGDEQVRRALKVAADEMVLHMQRIRYADDEPIAIQNTFMAQNLVPGLEQRDMTNQSLYAVLREHYYIYPTWTETQIEAMAATPDQADLLEIRAADPVLVVSGITYTESFDVVESVMTVYRGRGLVLSFGRMKMQPLKA